jgi:hypothetical protein
VWNLNPKTIVICLFYNWNQDNSNLVFLKPELEVLHQSKRTSQFSTCIPYIASTEYISASRVLRLAPTLINIFKEWVSSHLWIESKVNRFETFGNHIIIIHVLPKKAKLNWTCLHNTIAASLFIGGYHIGFWWLEWIRSNEWVEKPKKTFRAQPPPPSLIGDVEHGRVWGPKLCIFVTQLYKPMSLVAQPLLHPSLVYTIFTNLLQCTKHKCTKIIRNKKPKFLHNKLCIHTIIL